MRAVLIMPEGTNDGNLIWLSPYLYPSEDLRESIVTLEKTGYTIEFIEDGTGISFRTDYNFDHVANHFAGAFSWMNISCFQNEDEIDYQRDIFDYSLIALPVSRLQISSSILSESVCLFPPGEFIIEQFNLKTLDGKPFTSQETTSLRDTITNLTEISIEVFSRLPLLVFTKKLTFEEYKQLSHQDDDLLIKECSNYADRLMDLLRYYNGDYNVPEALPAKPGVWFDRYSAMLTHFPVHGFGNIQAREVELKSFSKGIGMEASITDQLGFRLLLNHDSNDLQNIAKHALKLNSAILESDNNTMKFAQIMMLLDYIGHPNSFAGGFKEFKKRLIPCLTTDREEYERISKRIKELTGGEGITNSGLRTQIIHMGKTIEELIPSFSDRKALFKELYGFTYSLIRHMIASSATTWEEYEHERSELRKHIFPD